jgi:transcription antitermination factor NusG
MPYTSPHWFALTVKPRHEKAVGDRLQIRSLEAYVPVCHSRRKWSDRLKIVELPLFPGYVFSRFCFARRSSVLEVAGVTSVVGFDAKPCPVSDAEIEAIRVMVGSGLPIKEWPYIKVGQRVRICEGSMSGLEGILIREKTGYRVVVNVELLNRAVTVELDRDWVRAESGPSSTGLTELYLWR